MYPPMFGFSPRLVLGVLHDIPEAPMLPERFVPTPQDLDLLDKVARAVARARRLSPADVEDFAQSVHVKMAERQYDAFRKFEGRASLRTYLTVVVARLLKDWQNHEYGKWRPCAAAARLGPLGAALDQELNRDGCSVEEAVRLVASRTGRDEAEVRRLADALPRRSKRRLVAIDAVENRGVSFDDPVAASERARALASARATLRAALADLPTGDVRLLARRYVTQAPVASLAKEAGVEAKGLYRHFDRLRRTLRQKIEARGVHGAPCAE